MLTSEISRGRSAGHGGRVLVPLQRSFRLSVPGTRAILSWSRPVGVEVEESGGRRVIPVRDPTRRWQWTFLAAGIAAAAFLRLAAGGHSRRRRRFFGR